MTRRTSGTIRVGVGGWTYAPWRGVFYPDDLPHRCELSYAARQLSSIEINGTYYRLQTPETFRKWHDETPDDFVFSLKAPRYVTNRRVLAETHTSIERFFQSGVLELKDKLGPINWQFMPTKTFDPVDFKAFLQNLPSRVGGQSIRHAVEVRHESFRDPVFIAMLRDHGVAVVTAGDSQFPQIAGLTADFVYVRIMGTKEAEPLGYRETVVADWAQRARDWARGKVPHDLNAISPSKADDVPHDVYLYVINGHKILNPTAARNLINQVRHSAPRPAAHNRS